MEDLWIIYKHTCKESNKSYIGLTKKDISFRWKQHVSKAKNEYYENNHFHNALRLYGADVWIHEILIDNIKSIVDAEYFEKYYIKFYDTFENGYNNTIGGSHIPNLNSKININKLKNIIISSDFIDAEIDRSDKIKKNKPKKDKNKVNKYVKKDIKIYHFKHFEYGEETLTIKEMIKKYNINIYSITCGQKLSCKGWFLFENYTDGVVRNGAKYKKHINSQNGNVQ